MNKHAGISSKPEHVRQEPAHSEDWTDYRLSYDWYAGTYWGTTPGRHAKPFAAHHPARPVTYDAQGTVTPLTPAAHVLDVAA